MRVKLLNVYASAKGTFDAGTTIDLDPHEAQQLIAGRYAEPVGMASKAAAAVAERASGKETTTKTPPASKTAAKEKAAKTQPETRTAQPKTAAKKPKEAASADEKKAKVEPPKPE